MKTNIAKLTIAMVFGAMLLIASCSKENSSASCTDGIQNGTELGIDCGGDCPPCPTCTDGVQNGSETGVDCGGECPACPTCTDGIQNGNETGVDCGGSCPPCVVLGCTNSNAHNYNPNATQDDGSCQTCTDGVQNGSETGVDCGGSLCEACPQLGDSGPAGGLIFYDKGTYSNGWRYLEYGIEIQGGDKQWGCRTSCNTSLTLGSGFENTQNVINNYNQGTCTESPDAFLACSNLVRNNHDDWYLPSANELQKLYPYRSQMGLGAKRYWSSSEQSNGLAYIVDFGGENNGIPHTYTWSKSPGNNQQGLGAIIAIRRF